MLLLRLTVSRPHTSSIFRKIGTNRTSGHMLLHVQDASAERPHSSSTDSDAHESSAHSAGNSAGNSATTIDSLVYGVKPEDTEKVVKVLQQVTGVLQIGSITSMLYNVARSTDVSYQAACRCWFTSTCCHIACSNQSSPRYPDVQYCRHLSGCSPSKQSSVNRGSASLLLGP